MPDRVAAHADDEMGLLRLLRVEKHPRAIGWHLGRRRHGGLLRLDAAEQLFETVHEAFADPTADSDDDPLGLIPGVEVGDERLSCRRLDGLFRAEDVPPERLVGIEQPVVDAADVALRVVEVDVHLLEDYVLLLLDLRRIEARVQEHVAEHVEGESRVSEPHLT